MNIVYNSLSKQAWKWNRGKISEPETYDKNTHLERISDQVRTTIIREPYEKMPENVLLSGLQAWNERGNKREMVNISVIKAFYVKQKEKEERKDVR